MDANFRAGLETICSGDATAALITVTRVKGSTPRKPGAKMLLLRDGQTFGTIGGGCGEAEVRREALAALDSQTSSAYWVNMTNDVAEEEGMVCGGVMEVFIDIIRLGASPEKELIKDYLWDLENKEEPVLVTVLNSPDRAQIAQKYYLTAKGIEGGLSGDDLIREAARKIAGDARAGEKTTVVQIEGQKPLELLVEPAPAPVELLILGGGHIALPLATMAKILGYRVTVVDDRPTFANPGRFPGVDRVICDDFGKAIEKLKLGPKTFVVIVTRGHKHDKVCLRKVITGETAYTGMIGSRRRVKALLTEMEQEGIDKEVLKKVHTPIGLDIGAETPEEIAISILAEVIKVNRGGKVGSLKLSQAELEI